MESTNISPRQMQPHQLHYTEVTDNTNSNGNDQTTPSIFSRICNSVLTKAFAPFSTTYNWVQDTSAAKLYSHPLSFTLQCFKSGIADKDPISDPIIQNKLTILDKKGRLTILSHEMAIYLLKIVGSSLRKTSANPVTEGDKEKLGWEEIADIFEVSTSDILSCSTFIVHRIIAYLSCSKEGQKLKEGDLLVHLFANLYDLITQNITVDLISKLEGYRWLYNTIKSGPNCDQFYFENRLEEEINILERQVTTLERRLFALGNDKKQQKKMAQEQTSLLSYICDLKAMQLQYIKHMQAIESEIVGSIYLDQDAILCIREEAIDEFLVCQKKSITSCFKSILKDFLHSAGIGEEFFDYFLDKSGFKGGRIESSLKWLAPKDGLGDGKIATMVFDSLLTRGADLLDYYVIAQNDITRGKSRLKTLPTIIGEDVLYAGCEIITKILFAQLVTMLQKKSIVSTVTFAADDLLFNKGIRAIDHMWVHNLLTAASFQESNINNALHSNAVVRLFKMLKCGALKGPHTSGNIFERFVVNLTHLITDQVTNYEQLNKAIDEYDRQSAIADVLCWRDRYLRHNKGVKSFNDHEQALRLLTAQDIPLIYAMAGYDEAQCEKLSRVIKEYDDELTFFTTASSLEVNEAKVTILKHSFLSLSNELFSFLGLDSDEDFDLPFASGDEKALYNLKVIREVTVPEQLLELYRHISDYRGVKAARDEKGALLFGQEHNLLEDFAVVLAKNVFFSVRKFCNIHASTLAFEAENIFPNGTDFLAHFLKNFCYPNSQETSNYKAMQSLHNHIENTLIHCICKVITTFKKSSIEHQEAKVLMRPQEQGLFAQIKHVREKLMGNGSTEVHHEKLSLIAADTLSLFAELFLQNRNLLKEGMREYWVLDQAKKDAQVLFSKKSLDEKEYTNKILDELMVLKRQKLFKPLIERVLVMCGLSVEDFFIPKQGEEFFWNFMVDQLQGTASKVYIDITKWQRSYDKDCLLTSSMGLYHGRGTAVSISHYAMRVLQGMLALNNGIFCSTLVGTLASFADGNKLEKDNAFIKALTDDGGDVELRRAVTDNLSSIARDDHVNASLTVAENYLQPIFLKMIMSLGNTFKVAQDNNPKLFKEVVRKIVLFVGEHCNKIRACAIRKNAGAVYDVDPHDMLKIITSGDEVLEYVILKEKEEKARKHLYAIEHTPGWKWIFKSEEKYNATLKEAIFALKAVEKRVNDYAAKKWPDGGEAVKKYLATERCLRDYEGRLCLALQRGDRTIDRLFGNDRETKKIKKAQFICKIANERLDLLKQRLDASHVHPEHKRNNHDDKLINLCLEKEYQELLEKLEFAKRVGKEGEIIKAKENLDQYSLENYYKPLSRKILKFANGSQLDKIPFPNLVKSYRETVVAGVKDKLFPAILGGIIEMLAKPETLLNLAYTVIKQLNEASEASEVGDNEALSFSPSSDPEFDTVCGAMIIEAIISALGEEGELILSLVNKSVVKEAAGRALGASLRKFIEKQSLTQVYDNALRTTATTLIPTGNWTDGKDFVFGNEKPVAVYPEDLSEQSEEARLRLMWLESEFNKELGKLAAKNGEMQVYARISGLSRQWEKVRDLIHRGIDYIGSSVTKWTSIKCTDLTEHLKNDFDGFSHKIYVMVAAVVNLFASIIIWPVVRFVNIYFNSTVTKIKKVIGMSVHKRLIFQVINIIVATIEESYEKGR